MKPKKHFLSTMMGSWIKIFISAMLAQYIAMGKSVFELDTESWKSIAAAGISAIVLVMFNFFNKNDPRYGPNKEPDSVYKR